MCCPGAARCGRSLISMMSMPVDMERAQQRQCLAVLTQPVHLVLLPPPRISHSTLWLPCSPQSTFKLQTSVNAFQHSLCDLCRGELFWCCPATMINQQSGQLRLYRSQGYGGWIWRAFATLSPILLDAPPKSENVLAALKKTS